MLQDVQISLPKKIYFFSVLALSEYRSTMSMFIKFTRQNLTLLTIHLKNVYLCIFIFGCTAIFSYFISFAVSTSSALKEHHVNLCSLPSPLSYLGAHPKHSKVGDFWDLNLFSPISKYFFLSFALILNIPR